MSKRERISMSVIKRLPRYYRFLGDLKNKGVTRISSRELSQKMGLTASQIRQDLNCFGGFGQQGYGYMVEQLYMEIGKILGVDKKRKIVLIGAGNLGRAIASHLFYQESGFQLVGVFDNDPEIIGNNISGYTVMDSSTIESFCKTEQPCAAILCVPRQSVRQVAQQLINIGINVFWNFSHFDLSLVYPQAIVENVHLNDSLMTLSYLVSNSENKDKALTK